MTSRTRWSARAMRCSRARLLFHVRAVDVVAAAAGDVDVDVEEEGARWGWRSDRMGDWPFALLSSVSAI